MRAQRCQDIYYLEGCADSFYMYHSQSMPPPPDHARIDPLAADLSVPSLEGDPLVVKKESACLHSAQAGMNLINIVLS